MEVTKRTYQKHKTEKKITVKHYLIDNVKEDPDLGYPPVYPIYVQVTYKRKNTKFRCKIPYSYFDKLPQIPVFENLNDFEEFYIKNYNNYFENALTRDLNFIYWIVKQQIIKKGDNFDISELPEIYHNQAFELSNFVELCLKLEIQRTLCDINNLDITHEILPHVKFPFPFKSPALANYEYYINEYPELISVKNKYSPNIWLLSIYIELGERSYGIYGNPAQFVVINEENGDVITFQPSIFDYLSKIFHKLFDDKFKDKQMIKHLIADLDLLFSEYYPEYFDKFHNI
jgi:hypothetical protein